MNRLGELREGEFRSDKGLLLEVVGIWIECRVNCQMVTIFHIETTVGAKELKQQSEKYVMDTSLARLEE